MALSRSRQDNKNLAMCMLSSSIKLPLITKSDTCVFSPLVQKLLEEGDWIEILTKPANIGWPAPYPSPKLQPSPAETTIAAALQPHPQHGSYFAQEWHFRIQGMDSSQLLRTSAM
jgi:hypothetical protein